LEVFIPTSKLPGALVGLKVIIFFSALWLTPLLHFMALVLGAIGLFLNNKKLFAVLGVAFNALMLLILIALIITVLASAM